MFAHYIINGYRYFYINKVESGSMIDCLRFFSIYFRFITEKKPERELLKLVSLKINILSSSLTFFGVNYVKLG